MVCIEAVDGETDIDVFELIHLWLPILVGCDVVQCAHLLAQIRAVIKIDKIGADKALLIQHINHARNFRKIRARTYY